MTTISKKFYFTYMHRVFTQNLDKEYALDDTCVCRRLHEHNGMVEIKLTGPVPQDSGMFIDYKELNLFGLLVKILNNKAIICKDDPLLDHLFPNWKDYTELDEGYGVRFSNSEDEWLSKLVVIDDVPTSENLAKLFYSVLDRNYSELFARHSVKIEKVTFSETKKTTAEYKG